MQTDRVQTQSDKQTGRGQTAQYRQTNRQTDNVHTLRDETEETATLLSLPQSHTADVTF